MSTPGTPPSSEAPHLHLTTTGRRTGRPREIEIWFTAADGAYYVIAEHGLRAHWVQNLLADPRVVVRIGDERQAARARVVDAAAEPGRACEARERSERKYGWGDGLVVELRPTPERPDPAAGQRPPTAP